MNFQGCNPKEEGVKTRPAYGYKRDVLLMVKVTPPKEIKTNQVTLKTSIRWMY